MMYYQWAYINFLCAARKLWTHVKDALCALSVIGTADFQSYHELYDIKIDMLPWYLYLIVELTAADGVVGLWN